MGLEKVINFGQKNLNQNIFDIIEEDFRLQLDKRASWLEKPNAGEPHLYKFTSPSGYVGGIPFVELILTNCIMQYLEHSLLKQSTMCKEFCLTRQNILIRNRFTYYG